MPSHPRSGIRILIVDDHLMVRAGLRALIEKNPRIRVVGMAGNPSEAIAMVASKRPDLIILDTGLGGEEALAFLAELLESAKKAPVLVLTCARDGDIQRRAIRLGAMGALSLENSVEVLIKAIEKVHAGELWLDRATMGKLVNEMTNPADERSSREAGKIAAITDREREVISLVAEGLRNRQIGERLFISETTVTHHLSSIFSKLEVSDRVELVIYAFRHKLAKIPSEPGHAKSTAV